MEQEDTKEYTDKEWLDYYAERWSKVVDNFRYIDFEYRHKEKEFGVSWRTEFKLELDAEYNKFMERFENPLAKDGKPFKGDKFDVMGSLVEKDYTDAIKFYNSRHVDMLHMLKENLELFESTCTNLRGMLKDSTIGSEDYLTEKSK